MVELLDAEYWLTPDDVLFMRLEFRAVELGQVVRISRLVYLHEETIGFSTSYLAPAEEYDTLAPTIDHSFCSLKIIE